MPAIFVDSAALIAIGSKSDKHHNPAVRIYHELTRQGAPRFVTTSAVLFEVGNAFSQARYKGIALQLFEAMRTSPRWDVVAVDAPLLQRGISLFSERQDKD